MEQIIFTASVEIDRKVLDEYGHCTGSRFRRGLLMVMFPLMLLIYLLIPTYYRRIFSISYIVSFLLKMFLNYRNYNRSLDQNGGKPVFNSIVITNARFRINNPMKENTEHLSFSQITGAWRSKNLLHLTLGKKEGRLIDLRMLSGGTPEELMDFIRERCPHWKKKTIPRRISLKPCGRILTVLAVIGLLTTTPGSNFGTGGAVSARAAADALNDLGITGITEEHIRELEAFEEEYGLVGSYNAVPDLLYFAGFGEYDPETWEWTPARNGVYTFDTEAWEVSMMYTDFLRGVSAMSGGELEFTDVVEDNSAVDSDAGTGIKTVSFTFREETYTLTAEAQYDWYDMNFLDQFARVVNGSGGEKKIWYLINDSQLISVFYRDDAWAREFRSATGYSFVSEISDMNIFY